jgi:hypothetical protein
MVARLVDQRLFYEVCGSMTENPVELFDDLATRVHATCGIVEVSRWRP